ncbi:hypothetical protein [Phormidium nigroviride]
MGEKIRHSPQLGNTGLTHPTKETGFFDQNTSPSPTDALKNPVSGAP